MSKIVCISVLVMLLTACGTGEPPAAVDSGAKAQIVPPSPRKSILESLPEVPAEELDLAEAGDLIALSLKCVDQEYPNKPSNVVADDDGVRPPRELHPAFYGCFDWHSAVHGHWAMVRLLKKVDKIEQEHEVRKALDAHLTEEKISREIAYFSEKHHGLFERPYGWGWLLRLKAELSSWPDEDARRWSVALAPLSEMIERKTIEYLAKLSVPLRAGTHHSTAYAMVHMHDHATQSGNKDLEAAIVEAAKRFYLGDKSCPTAYEPSGEDFISPCLAEADLMGRVLSPDDFSAWMDGFMPSPDSEEFAPLHAPPQVKDRHDPRIGHLIGLSFHRAAAFESIASRLPRDDERVEVYSRLAAIHARDGLKQMADSGYGGEHWLASFAIYMLTRCGPYSVAPAES